MNAGPVSPRDRIRWFTVRNCGTTTIPGFGLCSTKLSDVTDFECQQDVEGQIVWRIYPCTETECYTLQDPTQLWVNGPTAIEPGKYGKASQDWPLQVLHNGKKDQLANGYECGPAHPLQVEARDHAAVWSSGNALICQSHDATLAANNQGLHTVWVAPNTRRALPVVGFATFYGTYQKAPAALNFGSPVLGIDIAETYFTARFKTLLWVAFSGTLTSADATEGSPLTIRAYVDDEPTDLYAYRSMEIDSDYPSTTYRTNENVATSGLLLLEKDQRCKLMVGSSDQYDTTVSAGVLSFHRVYMPYDRSVSSALHSVGP